MGYVLTEDKIDECLQQLYDWADCDDLDMQLVIQYVHEHKDSVSRWCTSKAAYNKAMGEAYGQEEDNGKI